ncbi:hypothetical protein [Mycobacterium avium]|uniref:hypothetical protein n=1 Tax=Mycobacterium avium TaxID=1764 RepID=UPI00111C7025|nr:hypothetical protein [Mycobacterium avium]
MIAVIGIRGRSLICLCSPHFGHARSKSVGFSVDGSGHVVDGGVSMDAGRTGHGRSASSMRRCSMRTPEGMPVIDAFCAAVAAGGYGDYEALRDALGATGGRAGVRHAKPRRISAPAPDDPDEPALFEVAS